MKRRLYGFMVSAVFVWLPMMAMAAMSHGSDKGKFMKSLALWWV